MAEAVETVDREDQKNVATHFLRNSPPGQFAAVLQDVQVLCAPTPLDDAFVGEAAKDFNGRTNRVLRDGDHPPLILSKLAQDPASPAGIFHPKSMQVFTVDHAKMVVVGAPKPMAGPMDPALEASRAALETALEAYVARQYQEGTAAAAVYASGGKLTAVVSGERLNLRNFWSGLFVSTWTVQPPSSGGAGGGGGSIAAGEIKVRAHYFEDGNVQLQTKKAVAETPLEEAGADFAAAVVAAITKEEKALQAGLELMYANMTDETFKAMRRVMPVHRNKMNWNINEVKSRMQLGTKK